MPRSGDLRSNSSQTALAWTPPLRLRKSNEVEKSWTDIEWDCRGKALIQPGVIQIQLQIPRLDSLVMGNLDSYQFKKENYVFNPGHIGLKLLMIGWNATNTVRSDSVMQYGSNDMHWVYSLNKCLLKIIQN